MHRKEICYPFHVTGIYSAYDFNWDANFRYEGESHNFWEVVCVLHGEVEVVENEKVYTLHAQNLICHAPMEFHRIRSAGGSSPHVLILTFFHEGEMPSALGDGLFSLSSAESEEYSALFARLFAWFHGQSGAEQGGEAGFALSSFLCRIAGNHVPKNEPHRTGRAAEYRRLIEVMQASVCENLSLGEIAARAAVSIGTVKSLFALFSGISPMNYYGRLRAQTAMQYLESGLLVTEVSEKLGFSSPNYFSLFFKRNFGISPGRCKK